MKSSSKYNSERCGKCKTKFSEILIKVLLKVIVSITIITVTIHIGSIIFNSYINVNTQIIIIKNISISNIAEN